MIGFFLVVFRQFCHICLPWDFFCHHFYNFHRILSNNSYMKPNKLRVILTAYNPLIMKIKCPSYHEARSAMYGRKPNELNWVHKNDLNWFLLTEISVIKKCYLRKTTDSVKTLAPQKTLGFVLKDHKVAKKKIVLF